MDNLDPNTDNQDPNATATATPDPSTQQADPAASTLVAENWRDHVDVSRREHPSMQNFKNIDDLANGYLNAQNLVGKEKLPMPGKDATLDSAEYSAVFDRLGRPSDPTGYELPKVEVPQGVQAPDETAIKDFQTKAHSLGLLPAQVQELYKYDLERQAAVSQQIAEAQTQELQTTETNLRKEYGKSFDARLASVNGLINKFGGPEMAALVANSGMGRNEQFLKFMANVAQNFGEDGEMLGESVQPHILSPAEAEKKIKSIKGDTNHPWHLRDHPEHDDAIAEMTYLFQMAHPEQKK
jgi:hypothetical protein